LKDKKILFLGFGGVAKCVLNYFKYYFQFNPKNVHIVDKCGVAIYGPNIKTLPKKNIHILNVNSSNFDQLIKDLKFKEGDIVIDLTFCSNTYYFVYICLKEGLNYINTSIEDNNDIFLGTSIDLQQKIIRKIYEDFKNEHRVRSNILIEFGQNPGMFQHYVLYAMNEMNKLYYDTNKDDFRRETLQRVITDWKIGTIFCSEIDNMVKFNDTNMPTDKIYNTWSVGGMISEGLDKTELAVGISNKYIKPVIPKIMLDKKKMALLPKYKNQPYEVIFLNDIAMKNSLNTICPVINRHGKIEFENFHGKLIHHGETFEMANYFGKNAPFMTYVYKPNKYAEASIQKYFDENKHSDDQDLKLRIMADCNSFVVLDNIGKPKKDRIVGHDTIGCTIYCGKNKVEDIFWCGSILSDTDKNVDPNFTATIIQVAAGVLSGLSYILEDKNKARGLHEPCDLNTRYILSKSTPLLGKFFFTKIPTDEFIGKFVYKKYSRINV